MAVAVFYQHFENLTPSNCKCAIYLELEQIPNLVYIGPLYKLIIKIWLEPAKSKKNWAKCGNKNL